MWPYSRPQLVLLVGIVLTAGVGLGVSHWRARHPELVDRIEQFDHAPPAPAVATSDTPTAQVTDRLARRLAPIAGQRRPESRRRTGARPEIERRAPHAGPLDINRASAEELRAVPGVGPVLAGRIVATRTSDGPFQSVDDLRRVRGLGRFMLDRLRPFVAVRD